jgi:hypothetical protein
MRWHTPVLRHFALLLSGLPHQAQAGGGPQHGLELKNEQQNGEQGLHVRNTTTSV